MSKQQTITEKLRALRDALLHNLVERDDAVRLALLAAVAGEHLLMIGPPGTAKSLVARRLNQAFADTTYFERLLTRFTVPEELFGPYSIKGLEEDRFERKIDRYLPTAGVAFLDEIFKANSAILNSMLTLLNEREFDNGTQRIKTPLVAVVGASNELPEGDELNALFDRFLLRLHVGPVSKKGFGALLATGDDGADVPAHLRLTSADLENLRAKTRQVEVPDAVRTMLGDLREWCTAELIEVSDRRWRKVVKLLQASAATNGRTSVSIWDCWLLQHCLWDAPEQREGIYEWYSERVGTSAAMDPSRLTRLVVGYEDQLKRDEQSRTQAIDEDGELLYIGEDREPTTETSAPRRKLRKKEPLYLAPDDANDGRTQVPRTRSEGYTVDELDALYISDRNWGRRSFRDWDGREKYLQTAANWVMKTANLEPLNEPTRHKPIYVDTTLTVIDTLRADVEAYRAELEAHVSSLQAEILGHLWVAKEFVEPAGAALNETQHTVEALLRRVDRLHEGFEALPVEDVIGTVTAKRGGRR